MSISRARSPRPTPAMRPSTFFLLLTLLLAGSCYGFHLDIQRSFVRAALARRVNVPAQRTTDVKCLARKNYVPSWAQRSASNVYGEQQSEYEAYAKQMQARDASTNTTQAAINAPAASVAPPTEVPPPPSASAEAVDTEETRDPNPRV